MNKLRRRNDHIPFPPVDNSAGHIKGSMPGNMMGYENKPEPATPHSKGITPSNMMGYPSSRKPLAPATTGYGLKPLSNGVKVPTESKKQVSTNG